MEQPESTEKKLTKQSEWRQKCGEIFKNTMKAKYDLNHQKILDCVATSIPRSFRTQNEIKDATGFTPLTLTKHLTALEKEGKVKVSRIGTEKIVEKA